MAFAVFRAAQERLCKHRISKQLCPSSNGPFVGVEAMEPRLLFAALSPDDVRPFYDDAYYLAHNPDVTQAIQNNPQLDTAFDHYYLFGMFEDRRPSELFDPGYYETAHPDARTAVNLGTYDSLMGHFVLAGPQAG